MKIERMKGDLESKEKRWNKEREGMMGKIGKLEQELEGLKMGDVGKGRREDIGEYRIKEEGRCLERG